MAKVKKIERTVTINDRLSNDFWMNEYFDYARYTIADRALPSIIDGLKPSARKIMHAAFSVLSTTKEKKFFDVVGATYSKAKYHHGDASLLTTLMTLACQYKDNLAPLEIVGSGGDLRSPEAAAPRYLDLKLSPWAKLLEKDKHILEYNYDGDLQIEPKYYLPILPLVLTARTTGMAVGYKYNSQVSYSPHALVEQCIHILEKGTLNGKLRPHIDQFHGSFKQVGTQIRALGVHSIHRDHLLVTELPPNITFAKYEAHLIKLLEAGKISSWEDQSSDGVTKYKIIVNPTKLAAQVQKGQHIKTYKLAENLVRPTYTLLDEHGKIIIFKTAEEVVKYFVEFRLSMYDKLKSVNIDNLEKRIANISDILKFLELYFAGKIVLGKDVPLAKAEAQIKANKLPLSVLDIRFNKMTKEEYDKLTKTKMELEKELILIKKTPTKTMYLQELKALLPDIKSRFPKQDFEIIDVETA